MAPEVPSEADFQMLGLKPDSKPSEVRQAYRALVKQWHPDRHHSESYEARAQAEKKFREIDEAYRRISGRWKKPQRSARHPSGVPEESRPHRTQSPGTKAHAAPTASGRLKIDIRPFLRSKIVLPALLLAAAVLVLIQLPSFLQDTTVDTETPASKTVEPSPADKTPTDREPTETDVPPSSTDLMTTPSPVETPALLQPQSAAPLTFFTLGSTDSEVLSVQGPPSRIQGQTWIYGLSEIQFRNGRVWRFNNFDGSLRVRMLPGVSDDRLIPDHITIGSSEDEVLLVQGTPTRVEGDRWFYGFAELVFKNGQVAEYDNYFGTLKMRILSSLQSGAAPEQPARSFFTIGSSLDEVLAVQGTPTAIHGNRWSYNFAFVFFRDGKVHSVTDSEGTLHFVAAEKPAMNR
jgi:hypothetical protein